MTNSSVFTMKRMYRLFRDNGRSLVVAMDHGTGLNVYPSLSNPARVLEAVVAGGADAVLTSAGIVRHYVHQLKSIGVILRVDGGGSELGSNFDEYRLLYNAEDALRLGADAVCCMGFPGTSLETLTLGNVAALARQCQTWQVPLMVEMVPGGFSNFDLHTVEHIRLAARIGAELGADFIKTEFAGTAETYQQVTANCYRPVLVLGGSKKDDDRALLTMVKTALEAGVAGVVIGRNIWGHSNPRGIVAALAQVIHQDAAVDEALEALTHST